MGKAKQVTRMTRPITVYTKAWLSGGAGLFAQELVTGMLDAGGQVIFIAPQAENDAFEVPRAGLARIRPRRELRHGSRLHRIVASILRVGGSYLGLARARLRTRIFVVTIPDPFVFSLPMLVLLRLSGARIIYVVHDPLPHAWKLPMRYRRIEDGSFQAMYSLSRALVVLSAAGGAVLSGAYRLGSRPVCVIEHGVFVLGHPTPAPGNGVLLLFGTLRRNKGIREAIAGVVAARAEGAQVRLVIAGAPDPVEADYWAQCEVLARAHPEAITLEIGYVEDSRLHDLIAVCDAFLLPYRDFNSQSGVAMLASSNARTVIASRAGGIGDLISDGMAAVPIEAPVDEAAVAAAVRAFAAVSAAEWNVRAMAYRAHTIEARAWPVIGKQYLDLAELVDSR